MAALLDGGKLRLSGFVGDTYFDDGFTSADVIMALAEHGEDEDLEVHINSPGGYASEGAAIHALLTARAGTTNVTVEGIAASAASLITMAGERVTMSAGAVMMIHDPSGITFGTSKDHEKTIEGLEAMATAFARVYAAKSGKTAEACRAIMKEERWLTPQQAVDEGFADATTEAVFEPVAAFDYRIYAHAPRDLKKLAAAKDWRLPDANAAPAAHSRQPKEPPMTDKEKAEQLAAENAQLKKDMETMKASGEAAVTADRARRAAIMALEETKGRESLAEHLFTKGESVEDAKATLAASPKASADPDSGDDSFEQRRLNGEGLNGGGKKKPVAMSQAEASAAAVARMRKTLGLKETANG